MNCPLKVTRKIQDLTDNESIALAFIKLANVKLELLCYREIFLPESFTGIDDEDSEDALLFEFADKALINHALEKLSKTKKAIKHYKAELEASKIEAKAQADVIDATTGLQDIENYLNEIEAELRIELVAMEAEFKAEMEELAHLSELDASKKQLAELIG
ncbi:MAG: hypothetical protein CMI12_04935 [Oceanospirillum sp.]|nr:hypothetical protein [Oceanospirillum sp.]